MLNVHQKITLFVEKQLLNQDSYHMHLDKTNRQIDKIFFYKTKIAKMDNKIELHWTDIDITLQLSTFR